MKARVKATGEIVEVTYTTTLGINTDKGFFLIEELEGVDYELNYWTRLEHQAAIAAMGGICGNTSYDEFTWEIRAEDAIRAAHALVEKMKEERK